MCSLRFLVVILTITASSYNVEGSIQAICNIILNEVGSYYCGADDLNVTFHLHNQYWKGEQKICHDKSCSYYFDPNQPTAIIIHGYLSGRDASWIPPMIDNLRRWQKNKMNVITVQWCKNVDYYRSAEAVGQVADKVASMVRDQLFNGTEPKGNHIHIIGHSLGAHIAGLTASMLKNTIWPVDRVTGLDPAKPFFDLAKNAHLRLNKNVARFVDVIHTNSHSSNSATLGLFQPMGHLDFYPNGGIDQPNCNREGKTFDSGCFTGTTLSLPGIGALAFNLKKGLLWGLFGPNHICDHGTAPEYFTKSLNRRQRYFATKIQKWAELNGVVEGCPDGNNCINDGNCPEMGMRAEDYAFQQGNYYLQTECD